MLRVHAQYIDEFTGLLLVTVDTAAGSIEREEVTLTFETLTSKLLEKDLIQTVTNFYIHLPLEPSWIIRQVRNQWR